MIDSRARPMPSLHDTVLDPSILTPGAFQHLPAGTFPTIHPIHWLHSHFAVGGLSPLRRLSGMLTAHMTRIAPRNGFVQHHHRGLEIYTWVIEGALYHEDTTGGRGEIRAGEFQRMFSGRYIEHQELNLWDEPTRVIQIWFMIDPAHEGVEPHYQQLSATELPHRTVGDATVRALIGDGSPMEQHMRGRLTAATLEPGGTTSVELPRPGEELFLYVTDGRGSGQQAEQRFDLGQYDVILARPGAAPATLWAAPEEPLHFLSFYLPPFLPAR